METITESPLDEDQTAMMAALMDGRNSLAIVPVTLDGEKTAALAVIPTPLKGEGPQETTPALPVAVLMTPGLFARIQQDSEGPMEAILIAPAPPVAPKPDDYRGPQGYL